ncbi:MAG: hypothetical protein H6667_13090 [Ardenticatenaceae bacterium]|nr:hypothetical protein [Ardenticatenaceae bacterium]MCB9442680.1 hypothetical protein [Ardenticatenaceae bacterium]
MTKITFSRWTLTIRIGLGVFLLALVLTMTGSPIEAAPATNTYAVTWYTADNGGGISSSGSYEVAGTIGQPDTAPAAASADYGLESGFWAAFMEMIYQVFLPIAIK